MEQKKYCISELTVVLIAGKNTKEKETKRKQK